MRRHLIVFLLVSAPLYGTSFAAFAEPPAKNEIFNCTLEHQDGGTVYSVTFIHQIGSKLLTVERASSEMPGLVHTDTADKLVFDATGSTYSYDRRSSEISAVFTSPNVAIYNGACEAGVSQ